MKIHPVMKIKKVNTAKKDRYKILHVMIEIF